MTISISEIEDAEFRLVDLCWRLPLGRKRDECNEALRGLRVAKASLLARLPSVLRKGSEMNNKRGNETGAGTTDTGRNPTHAAPSRPALLQLAHDNVHRASDGASCSKAGAALSNQRMTHLRVAADALHQLGAKCDAANLPPGGKPTEPGEEEGEGTRFDHGDKETASRACNLAKRLGRPVPVPVRSNFCWQIEGNRMGLDAIERQSETDRINQYRRSQGLVPLT